MQWSHNAKSNDPACSPARGAGAQNRQRDTMTSGIHRTKHWGPFQRECRAAPSLVTDPCWDMHV